MLVGHDNRLGLSDSPHSLSNRGDVTIPSWGDSNYFVKTQKLWNGAGLQGMGGCKSSGCTGKCCGGGMNGLFDSGMDISGWGITEWLILLGGAYLGYVVLFKGLTAPGMTISSIGGPKRKRRRRKATTLATDDV